MAETFDVPPEFEVTEIHRMRMHRTRADQGMVQRKRAWTEGSLRRWALRWKMLNDAGAARLRDMWGRTFGPALSMSFTPPGDTATKVRFVEGSLSLTRLSAVHFQVQVELEELR